MAEKDTETAVQQTETAPKQARTKGTRAANKGQAKTEGPYKVLTKLDPDTVIPVRNGFHGQLVYKSKKTGEAFIWEQFGDEQDITAAELKNARNASKAFFENNWFLIDDPEVLDYLGVAKYYTNALSLDAFDTLFGKEPGEIKNMIAKLSDGQRRSLIYRAKAKIAEGCIDSLKVIETLEAALGIELIER